jgi:hypothetical protein
VRRVMSSLATPRVAIALGALVFALNVAGMLFNLLRRRAQRLVDKRFNRARYDGFREGCPGCPGCRGYGSAHRWLAVSLQAAIVSCAPLVADGAVRHLPFDFSTYSPLDSRVHSWLVAAVHSSR